jgi:hypothetical protein
MLTNVGRLRVNESIKERRENLCSLCFSAEFCELYQINKENPEISLEFSILLKTVVTVTV